ncbi:tRNA (guanine(10)-N(2))-dimethyltransferase [Candidatus Geothermarchaeota archaeon]|nr:MAG: tRNA (guanine(10)-N(2))-dimethyltransferase [Candidatus Geothermarchaeota archaeon]
MVIKVVILIGGYMLFVKEGKALIKTKLNEKEVFYNPRGKFTRSLGVIVVAAEGEVKGRELVVADALAATGIRGIRYFLESGKVKKLFLNDISRTAYYIIQENLKLNKISGESAIVTRLDANSFLSSHFKEKDKFDLVDVDPYGSPAPYIDNSVSAVKEGGILAITATDLAPLCGIYPWPAFRKYWALPLRGEFCHEIAARILINLVVQSCGRKERVPEPILTCRSEHYIRVYVRIKKGKRNFPYEKIGFIYRCEKCLEVYVRSIKEAFMNKCPICGSNLLTSGPLWIGDLHSVSFLDKLNRVKDLVEEDRAKVDKFLFFFKKELKMPPYYYDVSKACGLLKKSMPSIQRIINALISMGFKATRTHFNPVGIKTTAPYKEFLEVIKLSTKA